jgi:hypothetical protein
MLPTNNSYSSTSNPHAPSKPSLSTGTRRLPSGRRRDPPLRNPTGGNPPRGRPVSSHRCRMLHPSSPPAPRTGGPAANAAALLFLPPALSLVHPALYLPAWILVLLTPARNSMSLSFPPPSPPDADNDQRRRHDGPVCLRTVTKDTDHPWVGLTPSSIIPTNIVVYYELV